MSDPTAASTGRDRDLRLARTLSIASVAWGAAAAVIGVVLGIMGGSLSLIGFAVDSAIDSAASVALVWRFHLEAHDAYAAERVEHVAARVLGGVLIAAAVALTIGAGRSLVTGGELHPLAGQSAVLVVSLVVLPPLAWAKARVARRLKSRALANDSLLTAAAAVLALVALVAAAATSTLGWSWADGLGSIVIAGILAREGAASLREGAAALP